MHSHSPVKQQSSGSISWSAIVLIPHNLSSSALKALYSSGCRTAKHKSSSSDLTANMPKRSAREHHTLLVSSATARCFSGFKAKTVLMLCNLSANLITMTKGSDTIVKIMCRNCASSCVLRAPSDNRILRLTNWFVALSWLTFETMEATSTPNLSLISTISAPASSTVSWRIAAMTAASARSSSSPGARRPSTILAVSMQCTTYGSLVRRICPSWAFAANFTAFKTLSRRKYLHHVTSTPYKLWISISSMSADFHGSKFSANVCENIRRRPPNDTLKLSKLAMVDARLCDM